MCDEYDDERMVAFWKFLAAREAETTEKESSEIALDPLGTPTPRALRPKPKSVLR